MEKKYDVFISYSRKDTELIQPILSILIGHDITYWLDTSNIDYGDTFPDRIAEALDDSSSVLFLCTTNSLHAPYCKKEIGYARNNGKKIRAILLNGKMPKQGWFALDYQDVNCVNITDNQQKELLLSELEDECYPERAKERERQISEAEDEARRRVRENYARKKREAAERVAQKEYKKIQIEQRVTTKRILLCILIAIIFLDYITVSFKGHHLLPQRIEEKFAATSENWSNALLTDSMENAKITQDTSPNVEATMLNEALTFSVGNMSKEENIHSMIKSLGGIDNSTSIPQDNSINEDVHREKLNAVMFVNVSGLLIKMILVEGGTIQIADRYYMGAKWNNDSYTYNGIEYTKIYDATLDDFYIGEVEVTQALWRKVMGENLKEHWERVKKETPDWWATTFNEPLDADYPMSYISWFDCQQFISKLNKITGLQFSLPTVAQWEFAASGGILSKGCNYAGSNSVDEVAWRGENSHLAHKVATKKSNELGIYDMSGNISEWCIDDIDIGGYSAPHKGGSYGDYANYCRINYHDSHTKDFRHPHIGMRLVLIPVNRGTISVVNKSVVSNK